MNERTNCYFNGYIISVRTKERKKALEIHQKGHICMYRSQFFVHKKLKNTKYRTNMAVKAA